MRPVPIPLHPADVAEAAAVLRRVLAAVDAGELDCDTPEDRAAARHLEGAALTFEAALHAAG